MLAATVPICFLSGCKTAGLADDPHFGDSVRYTVALQTADANRDALPLEGVKAEQAMRNYQSFEKIDKPPAPGVSLSSGSSSAQ